MTDRAPIITVDPVDNSFVLQWESGHTARFPNTARGTAAMHRVLAAGNESSDTRIGTDAAPVQSDVDQMIREYKAKGGTITRPQDKITDLEDIAAAAANFSLDDFSDLLKELD